MLIPGINPYIIHLGPLGIRWYGLFMAISMAIGIWVFVKRGTRVVANEDVLYNLALYGILFGVIGARFIYVITNPVYFLHHPVQIPMIQLGGLSIHGGLLGGFLFALIYMRKHRLPGWFVLDNIVPGFCVGVILVRIGNIFNQEILGHPSAFWFGRQPAQIYESFMGLILLLLFYRKAEQNPPDGFLFWYWLFWYSVFRFCSEAFRDNPQYLVHYTNHFLGIGFVTLTQWVTPFLIALAVWQMGVRRRLNLHSLSAAAALAGAAGPPAADFEGGLETDAPEPAPDAGDGPASPVAPVETDPEDPHDA